MDEGRLRALCAVTKGVVCALAAMRFRFRWVVVRPLRRRLQLVRAESLPLLRQYLIKPVVRILASVDESIKLVVCLSVWL